MLLELKVLMLLIVGVMVVMASTAVEEASVSVTLWPTRPAPATTMEVAPA